MSNSAVTILCYGGQCFWKPHVSANYTDVRAVCQADGGDTALIGTEAQYQFVLDNFK